NRQVALAVNLRLHWPAFGLRRKRTPFPSEACAAGGDARTMTARDGLPLAAFVAIKALDRLKVGTLSLRLPAGRRRRYIGAQPGPEAAIKVLDWRVFSRVMSSGDMGLAEGYMAGEWDSPDLVRLLELLAANEAALARLARRSWWRRQLLRLAH